MPLTCVPRQVSSISFPVPLDKVNVGNEVSGFREKKNRLPHCFLLDICLIFSLMWFSLHFTLSLHFTFSLQSSFYTQSAFYPRSAVCSPQSAVRSPQSAVRSIRFTLTGIPIFDVTECFDTWPLYSQTVCRNGFNRK